MSTIPVTTTSRDSQILIQNVVEQDKKNWSHLATETLSHMFQKGFQVIYNVKNNIKWNIKGRNRTETIQGSRGSWSSRNSLRGVN